MTLVYNHSAFDALTLSALEYLDQELSTFPDSAPGDLVAHHSQALRTIRLDYLRDPIYRLTPPSNNGGLPPTQLHLPATPLAR